MPTWRGLRCCMVHDVIFASEHLGAHPCFPQLFAIPNCMNVQGGEMVGSDGVHSSISPTTARLDRSVRCQPAQSRSGFVQAHLPMPASPRERMLPPRTRASACG